MSILIDLEGKFVRRLEKNARAYWGSAYPGFPTIVEMALRRELTRFEGIRRDVEIKEQCCSMDFPNGESAHSERFIQASMEAPSASIGFETLVDRYRSELRRCYPFLTLHKSSTFGEQLLLGQYYLEDGTSLVKHHVDPIAEARSLGVIADNDMVISDAGAAK